MKDKKEIAPEVPVQEQFAAIISFDEKSLNDKLGKIINMANDLNNEIKSLANTVQITYQKS